MPTIYLIGFLVMIVSVYVSFTLKNKFRQFSQIPTKLNGAQAAFQMLEEYGIHDVTVISVEGELTDHYNPQLRTVNLSHEVYYGHNVAAIAVAAHECGHAVQHAKHYGPLQFRSQMVPFLTVASTYMQWIILVGILLLEVTPIPLFVGVVLFAATTLFSFVTLPVEFDASRRALAWIKQYGIMGQQEYALAREALTWAALTYVVAAIGSLATLLYYLQLLMRREER